MTSIAIGADHRLAGCWYKRSPNVGQRFIDPPVLIVMHYTAGGAGAADWLCDPRAQASAHVVIERDGSIKQIVPFDVVAWHAGPSTWRGRSACNKFSIGIEVANWGNCTRRADGRWYSWAGIEVPASQILVARHKNGGATYGWETFTRAQLATVEELTRALIARYPSLTAIAGHDDIAPRIKVDPGPAFPMERYLRLVQPRAAETAAPAPAGTVRKPDGNVMIADIEASEIIKEAGDGQKTNWLQTLTGGGGLLGLGSYLGFLQGMDWRGIAAVAALGVVVIGIGVLTDWRFRRVKKRRRRMYEEGVA